MSNSTKFKGLAKAEQENRNGTKYFNTKHPEKATGLHSFLLNTIKQSVIAIDLDGTILYLNKFAEQLYQWALKEAIGRNIIELTASEQNVRNEYENMFQLRDGKSWTGEFIAKRKDNTTFRAQITNSPIYDDKETLIGILSLSVDTGEREIGERSIQESENKYRNLIEQASDGIHTYDIQGNFIEINSKLCQMLGYTSEELLRLNVRDLVPFEDLAANPIRIDELSAGKTLLRERRLRRKDGTLISVEISGKMIQPGVLQAIIRDISERKRIEEALRESEEKYRGLFNSIDEGFCVIEMLFDIKGKPNDYRFLEINPSFERMTGLENAVGKTARELVPDLEEFWFETYGRVALTGEGIRFENHAEQMNRWFDVYASRVGNADSRRVAIVFTDSTKRKQVESALLGYADRLRLITDAVPLLVSYIDKDHLYRFINRSYTEWFGKQPEEVIGKHLSEVLGKTAYQGLLPKIEQVLSGEEVTFEVLTPYENGERFIHANYIPEIDSSTGQCVGFHAFVQDISKRKQVEDALRRSHEELEARVRERTWELGRANKALQMEMSERAEAEEERVRILQQLITAQEDERSRIARDLHDQLGQQMTVLRLKLEGLKKMCADNQVLCREIDETRKLVRQLDSDVDFLTWQLRPTVLDDFGIVAALNHYTQQWSKHFNIPVEFNAERFGKAALTPEAGTHFYRIVQEALNNISKHAKASIVNILLEPRDEGAVLIIEDNGIGFEPDNQFYKVKGMGLTGMRERAMLIGGTLEIESGGGGTTIYVRVPTSTRREEKK